MKPRLHTVKALQRADLVASTMHHDQRRRRYRVRGRERLRQCAIELRATAYLDDARHAGSPVHSSSPNIRLAFWIACPAAPFIRLSIADVTSSVGCRVPASIVAESATTFRRATSRSVGGVSLTSMNGSPS